MDLNELEVYLASTLHAFKLKFKYTVLVKGSSFQFVVEDFGLILNGLNTTDYSRIHSSIQKNFAGWRAVYISVTDNVLEKRYAILWELMRCGYMRWLRWNYPNQVKNILFGTENLAYKIIQERLRIWGVSPKYKFLVEDNKAALRGDLRRELEMDPGFFDYMPEEYIVD